MAGVTMTLFRSLRRESHSRWFRSLVTPWTLPLLAREGVAKRRRPTCWLELGRLAVSPIVGCRSLKHPLIGPSAQVRPRGVFRSVGRVAERSKSVECWLNEPRGIKAPARQAWMVRQFGQHGGLRRGSRSA